MDDICKCLIDAFPKYTCEMYNGNEPSGKGHALVSGGYADLWSTKYGGGETSNDEILHFSFNLNHKVNIFIIGDLLNIIDNRYSGHSDEWVYCNKPEHMTYGCSVRKLHELEPEMIDKYLNTDIPNCKIWDIVRLRAKQLYQQTP